MFSDTDQQVAIKDRGGETVIVVGHALLDGPKHEAVGQVAPKLAEIGSGADDPARAAALATDYTRGFSEGIGHSAAVRQISRARRSPGRELGSP